MLSRALYDVHGRAASQIEQRGSVRAVGRDLQLIAAAEQRTDLTLRGVRVGGDDLAHLVRADANLERLAGTRVKRPPIDVGHQIAEAIDAEHFPVNRPRLDDRL